MIVANTTQRLIPFEQIAQKLKRKSDKPIHLDEASLRKLGFNTNITHLQSAIPRIRVSDLSETSGGRRLEHKGSGVVISSDGLVLTAYHNLNNIEDGIFNADFNTTYLPTRRIATQKDLALFTVPLKIIAKSREDDLAVLIFPYDTEDPWTYATLAQHEASNGETVYTLGHGQGERFCYMTSGEVMSNDFDLSKVPDHLSIGHKVHSAIVSSNQEDKGSSGGALCNGLGELYGMISCRFYSTGSDLVNLISNDFGYNPFSYIPSKGVKKLTGSIKTLRTVFPFLEKIGIKVKDILDGKPARSANTIKKMLKRT